MTFFAYILRWFSGPWIEESIRSWRQANEDAKTLVWDKTERRWKPRDTTRRWEGETAGIET